LIKKLIPNPKAKITIEPILKLIPNKIPVIPLSSVVENSRIYKLPTELNTPKFYLKLFKYLNIEK